MCIEGWGKSIEGLPSMVLKKHSIEHETNLIMVTNEPKTNTNLTNPINTP